MNNEEKRKTLLKRIEEGGIIDFVGPPRSGKTDLIMAVASDAKEKGFHVELINVRNYYQGIFKKLEELADSLLSYDKTLLVLDDCDAVKQLNDKALAATQRSIYLLSLGKGRSVILVRTDIEHKETFITNIFIPKSSYATTIATGVLFGVFTGSVAAYAGHKISKFYRKRKENDITYDPLKHSRKLLQEKYRKKVIKAFLDSVVTKKSSLEFDTGVHLLLEHQLLYKDNQEFLLPKWLVQIFQISELLTENGQLNQDRLQKIKEVINRCLYAQGVEGLLQDLSRTLDWLKDEMRLAGFEHGKKDYPLSLFLAQSDQEPIDFLSGLLRTSDLRKILPENSKEFITKEGLLLELLRRWSEGGGS